MTTTETHDSTESTEPVILETGNQPQHSIIWMHGLGADGNDFVPIVETLNLPDDLPIRFIFPHAPMRPVSINNGYVMRAWYDIKDPKLNQQEDEAGLSASRDSINTLIKQEEEQGIATENILLAGFSQGGAMALHTGLRYENKLAGIMALSCYLPLAQTLEQDIASGLCTHNASIPILMAHGAQDPIVPITLATTSKELLVKAGYTVLWKEYAMAHAVCADEIIDIGGWLQQTLKCCVE